MTNLEKFYPNYKMESFRVGSSALAHEPDDRRFCIDCEECPARGDCDADKEYRTCIDLFESWLRKEANEKDNKI